MATNNSINNVEVDTVAADSGSATPADGEITIAGGTDISTSASGSTVTINSSGGGGGGTTITTFTSSGTWNKDASTKWVEFFVWSGGGGGGSGRFSSAGDSGGGAGGTGSPITHIRMNADYFSSSEDITIGAGGTGGLSQILSGNDGNDGGDMNESSVGPGSGYVTSSFELGDFIGGGSGGTSGDAVNSDQPNNVTNGFKGSTGSEVMVGGTGDANDFGNSADTSSSPGNAGGGVAVPEAMKQIIMVVVVVEL